MSETIDEAQTDDGAVSADDLKRMLEESRKEAQSFRAERDEERSARQRTERERDEFSGRAQTETERRYLAELQAVENGVAAAQADADRAEEAYAVAGIWKAVR